MTATIADVDFPTDSKGRLQKKTLTVIDAKKRLQLWNQRREGTQAWIWEAMGFLWVTRYVNGVDEQKPYDTEATIKSGHAALTDARVRLWIQGLAEDGAELIVIEPRPVALTSTAHGWPERVESVHRIAERLAPVVQAVGVPIGLTIPENFV